MGGASCTVTLAGHNLLQLTCSGWCLWRCRTHVCALSQVVSRASRIFLYFRWEERGGEKNASGQSGQLPVPRKNVIIAAGHAHGMQIKTFIQLCVLFCEACARIGKLL